MRTLQEEIYETFESWKEDKTNRKFYDWYVGQIVGGLYETQQDFYFNYWNGLKKDVIKTEDDNLEGLIEDGD